ncbi:MAG: DUF3048 domain-containing protein [Candidatus Saccharimonadales bacterium]
MPDDIKSPKLKPEKQKAETFKSPEETALNESAPPEVPSEQKMFNQPKKHGLSINWSRLAKKQKILIIAGSSLLVMVIIGGVVLLTHHRPPAPTAAIVVQKPKPKPVPPPVSKLTGLPIKDAAINQKPVTGVMIENSVAARPQSGLQAAGVVFEALAEGGITRFLALFQAGSTPNYIGPVRSLRPYFLQWDMGFDAPIAHVGGSPQALSDVNAWHAKDLNQFYNPSGYHRIASRYAPHNDYTSLNALNKLESQKHFTTSKYSAFPRLKNPQPAAAPSAGHISLNLSYADYNDSYTYNQKANNYARFEAGRPHLELTKSGAKVPIAPKIVIAIVVPRSNGALDSSGAYYSIYPTIGGAAADVFQNGTVTKGSWQKASRSGQITFQNTSGQPIKLDPGQTWITAVSDAGQISYKP